MKKIKALPRCNVESVSGSWSTHQGLSFISFLTCSHILAHCTFFTDPLMALEKPGHDNTWKSRTSGKWFPVCCRCLQASRFSFLAPSMEQCHPSTSSAPNLYCGLPLHRALYGSCIVTRLQHSYAPICLNLTVHSRENCDSGSSNKALQFFLDNGFYVPLRPLSIIADPFI